MTKNKQGRRMKGGMQDPIRRMFRRITSDMEEAVHVLRSRLHGEKVPVRIPIRAERPTRDW